MRGVVIAFIFAWSNYKSRDNLTGLIWLKERGCWDNGHITWSDALALAQQLKSTMCGLTDGSASGDLANSTKLINKSI